MQNVKEFRYVVPKFIKGRPYLSYLNIMLIDSFSSVFYHNFPFLSATVLTRSRGLSFMFRLSIAQPVYLCKGSKTFCRFCKLTIKYRISKNFLNFFVLIRHTKKRCPCIAIQNVLFIWRNRNEPPVMNVAELKRKGSEGKCKKQKKP